MTLFLVALLGLFGLLSTFLAVMYLVSLARISQLKQQLEEEAAWANEYARRVSKAETELAQVRQEYAVLNWVYKGTNMMQLGAAWRAGVRVGKGKVGA